MYDALGSKADTLSETDLMEELKKLAVKETVAVVRNANYSPKFSEEKPVKQPTEHSSQVHTSSAHSSTAHSSPTKQPPAKFITPALAKALAMLGLQREDTYGRHGPAAGGGAEKLHPYNIHRQEDQQILTEDNSPMDVTTMDNVPNDASKTKDVGETCTKSTNDGDTSENHDDGGDYEKQNKGEVIQTNEIANKTPDDGNATQILIRWRST
jgi:hypothetical protein